MAEQTIIRSAVLSTLASRMSYRVQNPETAIASMLPEKVLSMQRKVNPKLWRF